MTVVTLRRLPARPRRHLPALSAEKVEGAGTIFRNGLPVPAKPDLTGTREARMRARLSFERRWRPTWSVLLVVLAVATATTVAVAYLLDKQDRSRQRQIVQNNIEIKAQEILSVPWEGIQLLQAAAVTSAAKTLTDPTAGTLPSLPAGGARGGSAPSAAWTAIDEKMVRLDNEIESVIDGLHQISSDRHPV